MSKAIVLVESHYRSRSWFLALKNIGLSHIISVMPEEYKLFKDLNFPEDNILNLFYNSQKDIVEAKTLSFYENFLNIRLNSIVFMDRTLRKKKRKYIEGYLIFLTNHIDRFFIEIQPKVIFIEPTWTHEILICKFAKKYNIPIVAPVKDKLLPDRFLAFKDENHLIFYKNLKNNKAKALSLEALSMVVKDRPVQYFAKFNNRNSLDLRKIPKLYRLIKISLFNYRNPNIQNSVYSDIYIKMKSIMRSKFQLMFIKFKTLNDIKKKYVLITLHVQPEASIDVVGTKYSNQIEFIRSIANTTPNEYNLLVKEHSHAIGNRPNFFYESLLEIPNVMLLHPSENARKAIKGSSLVISNTGTSSLEASMLSIPAVTATPMFYNKIMLQKQFNPFEMSVLELLKNKNKINKHTLITCLDEIYNGSFKGNCGDFQTDANVLKKENIKDLEMSFKNIIKAII
jgi:hypothetical protein